MARINLARRAEIGRAKRDRTRAAILEAARAAYGTEAAAAVTVEGVMEQAGLAKGTFYVHFPDLAALEAELGAALIAALDERLQPARLAANDPLLRFATALAIIWTDLCLSAPAACLAARAVARIPSVGTQIHLRMQEDLEAAAGLGLLGCDAALAVTLAAGIFIQIVGEIAALRIGADAIAPLVAATLRAIAAPQTDTAALADAACAGARAFATPPAHQAT